MKKLFAILLSLALMLPLCAGAEAAAEENWVTVDLGDFTMDLLATDGLQMGTKAESQVMFIAYPFFDANNVVHPNINAVWTADTIYGIENANDAEMEQFGQELLAGVINSLVAQNIAVSNEQLLSISYEAEANSVIALFCYDCDYSAAGADLQTPMYQMQIYMLMGDEGTYVFTLSAADLDMVQTMLEKNFATITFK